MKKVLLLFQDITELSINFEKSQVFHISNKRDNLSMSTEILGCQYGNLSFMVKKSNVIWNSLKDNLDAKLAGWKCSNTNMAGIMTLKKI